MRMRMKFREVRETKKNRFADCRLAELARETEEISRREIEELDRSVALDREIVSDILRSINKCI